MYKRHIRLMHVPEKAIITYIAVFIISLFGMIGLAVSAWFLQYNLYHISILDTTGLILVENIAIGCGAVFVLCIPIAIIGIIWMWVKL